jgi:hypothetical protein
MEKNTVIIIWLIYHILSIIFGFGLVTKRHKKLSSNNKSKLGVGLFVMTILFAPVMVIFEIGVAYINVYKKLLNKN